MKIETRRELKECVRLERSLWIARNYPQGAPRRLHSKELGFLKALRKCEYYLHKREKLWSKIPCCYWVLKYKVICRLCNVSIPFNCLGMGFLVMHLQNIVINADCEIGEYCCIYQNTTLGIKLGHKVNGNHGRTSPRLGNGITVCAGVCIVGNIFLEDGITVGANAVVTKSVYEPNVVVGGIPARVISREPDWSMLKFRDKISRF